MSRKSRQRNFFSSSRGRWIRKDTSSLRGTWFSFSMRAPHEERKARTARLVRANANKSIRARISTSLNCFIRRASGVQLACVNSSRWSFLLSELCLTRFWVNGHSQEFLCFFQCLAKGILCLASKICKVRVWFERLADNTTLIQLLGYDIRVPKVRRLIGHLLSLHWTFDFIDLYAFTVIWSSDHKQLL